VAIDGSGTRDPDNDPLTYQWALVAAPNGSIVKVSANTPTFAFRPDLPGQYQLKLTVSDSKSNASDTMRVTADALFQVSGKASFSIDGASAAGSDVASVKLRTSARHNGNPVTYTTTSSVPWLRTPVGGAFAGPGGDAPLELRLDLEQVRGMENGRHEARVTISPSGGWTGAIADVTLELAVPRVRHVLPYVAYVNEPSRITLHGEKLLKADGRSLFIGGAEALDIEAVSDTQATITLPPLAAGTYTVRIGDALGLGRESSRVVVRAKPVYADFQVHGTASGPRRDLTYDAERDALYYSAFSPGGERFAFVIRNDGTGQMIESVISSPGHLEPEMLALAIDGSSVYMVSGRCQITRVDPGTTAILDSAERAPCPEDWWITSIAPLADGRVLVLFTRNDGQTEILEYPGFTPTDAVPARSFAEFWVSGNHDRLLSVQTHLDRADAYDVGGDSRPVQFQAHPDGIGPANLSMSADGSRTLHASHLYDREFNRVGSLAGHVPRQGTAINPQGTRAVRMDSVTDAIYVHDLTASGPEFPVIGAPLAVPMDTSTPGRLLVPPAGGAVFLFSWDNDIIKSFPYVFVRVAPELAP
jgi:hypothetical protein